MSTQFVTYSPFANYTIYPTLTSFPTTAFDGSLAMATDTDTLYVFDAGTVDWLALGAPSVAFSIGAIDGGVASANGASIDLGTLYMQSASDTVPGLVNNTAQTFSGDKTFTGTVKSAPVLPISLGLIQLGTPGTPITAGSSYTYTVPLGGTYTQIILTNFSWVNPNGVNLSLPGINLGAGSFSQNDNGPMLFVNTTPGGWTRIFKVTVPEYANNVGTDLAAPLFATSGDVSLPLGYGNTYLNVAFDNIELETSPPKKFQIEDVYISGTDLKVVVKNSEPATTLDLNSYVGFSRIYGYLGDMYLSAVGGSGFIALFYYGSTGTNLWITENGGTTFNNYPNAQSDALGSVCAYESAGVNKLFMLTNTLNVYQASSPTYSWAQNNLWTLTQGVNNYKVALGGYVFAEPPGGKPMDAKSTAQCLFLFYQYPGLARLFKSVDDFVNIGNNSPDFDNGLPILEGESIYTEQDVNSAANVGSDQSSNGQTYVRVVDGNTIYCAFPFQVPYSPTLFNVTAVADVGGASASSYFVVQSGQYGQSYYLWMNVDGSSVDPAPGGGLIGIPVVYAADSNADTVAAAISTALNTVPLQFSASSASDIMSAEMVVLGPSNGITYIGAGLPIYSYQNSQFGTSLVNQGFVKTTNGGTSWSKLLASHPEFTYAKSKCFNISDDGQTILVAVAGDSAGLLPWDFPYTLGLYFNMSLDGGATFLYSTGSWPLISDTLITQYASEDSADIGSETTLNFDSSGAVVCIFRAQVTGNGIPSIVRSEDSGATWGTPVALAPYTGFGGSSQSERGIQCDSNDHGSCFLSPGNVSTTADSYVYKGSDITTFTNWGAYGI